MPEPAGSAPLGVEFRVAMHTKFKKLLMHGTGAGLLGAVLVFRILSVGINLAGRH